MQALQSITPPLLFDGSEQQDSTHFSPQDIYPSDSVKDLLPSVQQAAFASEKAGLAHDAGNLLGALNLYSDLLALPGVLSNECRAYAEELKLLAQRSSVLINRLINHAEYAGGPRKTILPELIGRYKGMLCKIAKRDILFYFDSPAFHPIDVSGDVIERILINLVKNAAEATHADELISVNVSGLVNDNSPSLKANNPRVVMTVKDCGRGISVRNLRKLLQSPATTPVGGRGLGIRIVRELVALSGGCLTMESRIGIGTSVSVEWAALIDNASGRIAC